MKVAIVVGHTKNAPGAESKTLRTTEYPWNKDLAAKIVAQSPNGIEFKTFLRDDGGVAGAYKAGDKWGADAFVELHFNSSHNVTSTGTGVLYQTGKSKAWAEALYAELSKVLRLKAWPGGTDGVCTPFQASGRQERGKGSLTASSAPSALIEPFFGSNPNDSRMAQSNKDRMAAAVARAAATYFKV